MALHRLTALALTGVLALSASGCGGDSPSPSPRTSSAAASPTPTSSGRAAPVLPHAATKQTRQGAQAFTTFWFETVTYAMHTGEAEALEAISAPECRGCNKLASMILKQGKAGQHIEGGGWLPVQFALDSRVAMPFQRFAVSVSQPRSRLVDLDGRTVSSGSADRFVSWLSVRWEQGRWSAFELK